MPSSVAKLVGGVKRIDHGWKKILENAKAAKRGGGKNYVRAGLLGKARSTKEEGGLNAVEIGLIHEFGAPDAGIPERSWIRAGFKKHKAEYLEMARKLIRAVVDPKPAGLKPMTLKQVLGLLGLKMAADIKAYVTQGDEVPPPNAPEVWLRKMGLTAAGNNRKGGASARRNFNKTGLPARTLVDTGQMVGSVTHEVTVGGTKDAKP